MLGTLWDNITRGVAITDLVGVGCDGILVLWQLNDIEVINLITTTYTPTSSGGLRGRDFPRHMIV